MANTIESAFEKLGVRVKVHESPAPRKLGNGRGAARFISGREPFRINVLTDGRGEYFVLERRSDVRVELADVRRSDRHLLLLAHLRRDGAPQTAAFLCGRDECHWFVAAIPERAAARDVQAAKDALKPQAVWDAIRDRGVPMSQRDQRRTGAFIRQGEWFFIPRPDLKVRARDALQSEPIRRGAGKPHVCQFLYRTGGERVFVCDAYPNGLAHDEYFGLDEGERLEHFWWEMIRDAHVFVKGNIRHPDHKTIWLPQWHEVVMNTEHQARAMANVAFLD